MDFVRHNFKIHDGVGFNLLTLRIIVSVLCQCQFVLFFTSVKVSVESALGPDHRSWNARNAKCYKVTQLQKYQNKHSERKKDIEANSRTLFFFLSKSILCLFPGHPSVCSSFANKSKKAKITSKNTHSFFLSFFFSLLKRMQHI